MRLRLLLGVVLLLAVPVAVPAAVAAEPELLPPELTFSVGPSSPIPDEPWWTRFGDPALGALVDEALSGNRDLRRTRALVAQADGARLAAAAGFAPTLNANANTTLAPLASLGFGFGLPQGPNAPKTYTLGGATLDAGWQVDPFGGSVASFRAAGADVRAAREDLGGASASVAALVTEAYLDAVTARERVALVRAQIAANEELLGVLELRYAGGDAGALDVLQQRQQLETTRAQLPTAELLLDTAGQRLAVLVGRVPTEPPVVGDRLPDVPAQVAVGSPVDLVDHRPDLRAAAARIQGARDRRWAAATALLPTLALQGRAGWQFIDRGEFIDQTYWNAVGGLTVPIFNGGRAAGQLKQARAAHDAQTAAFEATLLGAVQQVETALARERRQTQAVQALQAQLTAADQAFDLAREQYLVGLTPYINVQSALGRQQAAQLSLLQGRRDLLSARVALFEALGGPWTQDLGARAPEGE